MGIGSATSISVASFTAQSAGKPGGAKAAAASSAAPALAAAREASAATASQPSTGGKKDFATVAKDARAALDAGYKTSGKTGDNSTTAADWQNLLGGLDRRSLYAIASNEGGHFSEAEQMGAGTVMGQQLMAATGLNNPAAAANPTAAMTLAGIRFLDSVSDEEKSSMAWAEKRAGMQFTYESFSRQEGTEPETVESDSPLVKLIKGGLDNLRQTGDPSRQLKDTPEYQQAVQLSEQLKAGLKAKDKGGSARAVDITA